MVFESFLRYFGLIDHQLRSFNYACCVTIPEIIKNTSRIVSHQENIFNKDEDIYYIIEVIGCVIDYPKYYDNKLEKSCKSTPQKCIENNYTYNSSIYIKTRTWKIIENKDHHQNNEKDPNRKITKTDELHYIGNVPILVYSQMCNLNEARLPIGVGTKTLCEFDEGGYFLLKGNEKVIQSQENIRTNIVVVFEKWLKINEKNKKKKNSNNKKQAQKDNHHQRKEKARKMISSEIRSCREKLNYIATRIQTIKVIIYCNNGLMGGGSSGNAGLKGYEGHNILMSTFYIKKEFPCFLIFKAFGILDEYAITKMIFQTEFKNEQFEQNVKSWQNMEKRVYKIIQRSMNDIQHLKTRFQAVWAFAHLTEKNTDHWKKCKDEIEESSSENILSFDINDLLNGKLELNNERRL